MFKYFLKHIKQALKVIYLITALLFINSSLYSLNSKYSFDDDSTITARLQRLIDSCQYIIVDHSRLVYQYERLNDTILELKNKTTLLTDSITILNQNKRISQKYSKQNLGKLSNEKILKYKEIDSFVICLKDIKIKIALIDSQYCSTKESIQRLLENDSLPAIINIQFNRINYTCLNISTKFYEIGILNNEFGKPVPLVKFWENLKGDSVIAIMNAGMYLENGSAQGLLIEKYVVKSSLDTSLEQKYGNFYLYPNGVFYVDKLNKLYIQESFAFKNYYQNHSFLTIKYATQSGPLLVLNSVINKSFKLGSINLNIRNGVGISNANNTRAYFVISNSGVNLFDFAILFRDILNCNNALYLDGAISKMYFKDSIKSYGDLGGYIGPVITIHKSKKIK